jgi:hypothetical protein
LVTLAFLYAIKLIFNTLRRAERLELAAKGFEESAEELRSLIVGLKSRTEEGT